MSKELTFHEACKAVKNKKRVEATIYKSDEGWIQFPGSYNTVLDFLDDDWRFRIKADKIDTIDLLIKEGKIPSEHRKMVRSVCDQLLSTVCCSLNKYNPTPSELMDKIYKKQYEP